MKKIKHLKDIRQEKMRLRIRQLELEKQLKKNWKELKTDLKPSGFLKSKLEDLGESPGDKQSFWSAAMDYGAAYISHKLAARAGKATEAKVQDSVQNIMEKVRNLFGKKKK
ncbi:MAG TPA: hypothetical protein VFV31_07270 [Chitinophagaceae bacterium]|nr:hypothetical protein [Chitinophagaceae bacterium]